MTREDIKAQFKAGQITKDQAMQALAGLRGSTPPASRDVIKTQFKAGQITKDQAMSALAGLRGQQQPAPVVDDSLALPQQQAAMPAPAPMMRSGVSMPAPTGGVEQGPAPDYSFSGRFKSFVDKISGADRSTPEIEGMDDWTNMPELGGYDLPSLKVRFSRLLASDQSNIKSTILNNFPELEKNLRTDDKGNPYFVSDVDFKRYAIKPGIRMTDAPGIVGETLMSAVGPGLVAKGARRAAGLGGRVVGEGLTQGAIEGARAATGGDASLTNVGVAALTPMALDVVPRVVQGARGLKEADKVFDDVLGADQAKRDIGEAFTKTAESKRNKGINELVDRTGPDPERLQAVKDLGFEDYIQADHISTDFSFKELSQLLKSQKGSALRDAEQEGLNKLGNEAVEMVKKFGGTEDLGGLSSDIRASMQRNVDSLENEAEEIYSKLSKSIDDTATIDVENTMLYLADKEAKMKGKLEGIDRRVFNALKDGDNSYFLVDELRKEVGSHLKPQAFSDADQGRAKKLYSILTADQENAAKAFGVADQWEKAKKIVTSRKAIEDDMAALFSKKLDKSIVRDLLKANASLEKRDVQDLQNLLKSIPREYHQEFKASAILNSLNKGAKDLENGPVSFKTFSTWYNNLSRSPSAKNLLFQDMPKEAKEYMDNLAKVSTGIADSVGKYSGTGASLQQYLKESEGLLGSVVGLASDVGAITGGSLAGGAPGMVAASVAVGLYRRSKAKRDPVAVAVNKLLASNDFKTAVINKADNSESAGKIAKRLSFSKPFRAFAKAAKLPREPKKLENWILRSFRAGETLTLNKDNNEQ